MQSSINQSSQPSFEYRLMKGLRKAIPKVMVFVEVDNPSHSGIIITICDEQANITIQHKLAESDIYACDSEEESNYIATIISDLKTSYTIKKAA